MGTTPLLSVVVVVHNMRRELVRTLRSLSAACQHGIGADDYEVIVVDNGSSEPLDPALIDEFDGLLRIERFEPAPPSPARAANHGLALARGELLGLWIDGARLASPGLLAGALAGPAPVGAGGHHRARVPPRNPHPHARRRGRVQRGRGGRAAGPVELGR